MTHIDLSFHHSSEMLTQDDVSKSTFDMAVYTY